ncbi:MAG TPA: OsmC family peroxiredoxin [Verrucomicrobiae bacterium]|nr:OsmC family peroxiredoxin [Verrucomicrobiae bacterium]
MSLIIRKASVRWKGGAKGGARAVTTESGVLKRAKFSLDTALQNNSSNTDPGELLAAAHAGSFSMALSNELGLKALAPGQVVTSATVTLEYATGGWNLMNVHLSVVARLPKMTQGRFIDATVRAKTNCLVSRSLRANISMYAKLEKPRQ